LLVGRYSYCPRANPERWNTAKHLAADMPLSTGCNVAEICRYFPHLLVQEVIQVDRFRVESSDKCLRSCRIFEGNDPSILGGAQLIRVH